MKEESGRTGLKLSIKKTKFMASGPITSWQIGESGSSDRLYFLGLRNLCGQWLQLWNQKMLVPWKKSYDKPRQHIIKQKHYFADKGLYSQSYGFSSNMYGCESWIIKAEHQRIDALELWCWEDSWESLGLQVDQATQF